MFNKMCACDRSVVALVQSRRITKMFTGRRECLQTESGRHKGEVRGSSTWRVHYALSTLWSTPQVVITWCSGRRMPHDAVTLSLANRVYRRQSAATASDDQQYRRSTHENVKRYAN